jgi:hypothetical protein
VALVGVVSASCGKVDYVVPGGEVGGCFSTVGIGADLSVSDKVASAVVGLIQYERRRCIGGLLARCG